MQSKLEDILTYVIGNYEKLEQLGNNVTELAHNATENKINVQSKLEDIGTYVIGNYDKLEQLGNNATNIKDKIQDVHDKVEHVDDDVKSNKDKLLDVGKSVSHNGEKLDQIHSKLVQLTGNSIKSKIQDVHDIIDGGECSYSKQGKVSVSKANPVKTFKNYGPEFYVEFKIRISSSFPIDRWINILHVSNGGNAGAHGNRFPAIWLYKNNQFHQFHICSTVNHYTNYCYNYNYYTIELDHDYQIVVSQQYNDQTQLVYKIFFDGKELHSIVNTNGKTFDVVTLYLSDPWFTSINGFGEIWDFTILHGKFLDIQSKLKLCINYTNDL